MCCRNLSNEKLMTFILFFILINFILSFVAIFIRAANTSLYKEALKYLEQRNNGVNNNYDCTNGLYCADGDKHLSKPSDSVSYQDLFKKWKSVELAINIIRTIITLSFFLFSFFIIYKKTESMMESLNQNEYTVEKVKIIQKNVEKWIMYLIIILSFFVIICIMYIIIRALALTANDDIGLYEKGRQNSFEKNTALNYIIDIIEIVLYSISICFDLRFRGYVQKTTTDNINKIEKKNRPPESFQSPKNGNMNPIMNDFPINNLNQNINVNVNLKVEQPLSNDNLNANPSPPPHPLDVFH